MDPRKIADIGAGTSYFDAVPQDLLATLVADGQFSATGDFAALSDCGVIVIYVPTPLNQHREPDLSFVEETAHSIAAHTQGRRS